jgi:type VI secretion system secreted protein Hcp
MRSSSRLESGAAVALAFALSVSGIAARADEYYMRMTGDTPSVIGESTVRGYEHWIQLESVGWGVTAESSWTKGGGASVGKPQPGAIHWTQNFDSSVPAMYSYLLTGKDVPNVVVEYARRDAGGLTTYLQLNMESLLFTDLSFDGSTVTGAGVFKKISMTYWPVAADGSRDQPVNVVWDIPAGSVGTNGSLAAEVAGYGSGNLAGKRLALAAIIAQDVTPVPEPGTWVTLMVGLVLVGFGLRRRNGVAHRGLS